MKFPIISTIVLAACAFAATAQAELKIASVNVTDLYTKFHKRFTAENELKDHEAKIRAELKVREDKLKTLREEDKKITGRYDPSLSEAATKKLRDEHAAKLNEIQAATQEYETFKQRRSLAFREMHHRTIVVLLQEVQAVINDVTSKGGYDLVIDSGAKTPQLGTDIFLYVKSSYDITPEVLKQLNADAPADFDPVAELKRLNGQPAATPAAN